MALTPHWLRGADPSRVVQAVLASAFLMVCLVLHAGHGSAVQILAFDLVLYGVVIVGSRWPWPGAVAVLALGLGMFLMPPDTARLGEYALAMPLVSGACRGPLRPWLGYTAIAWALLAALTIHRGRTGASFVSALVLWAFVFLTVWIVAVMFRLLEKTERISRENALTQQRLAVARDLHDTVAHNLTHIVMLAERSSLQPQPECADLLLIADAARDAVTNMRATLVALRDPAPGAPAPCSTHSPADLLTQTTDRLRAAGFATEMNTDLNGVRLSPDALAMVAAFLGEAANNVVKHGDPAQPCGLMAEATAEGIEIAVLNKRRLDPPATSDVRLGLVGLQERATEVGGCVAATATDDRWMILLTIPLQDHRPPLQTLHSRAAP